VKPNKSPKHEEKSGQLDKLKNRVRRLERENARLKSELNSYEQAFKNTKNFLREHTDEFSLEKLIEGAKGNKSLRELQKDVTPCPKCVGTLTVSSLPFGTLHLCTTCGHKEVVKNGLQIESDDREDS
jgi:exonuclease VII small subunit